MHGSVLFKSIFTSFPILSTFFVQKKLQGSNPQTIHSSPVPLTLVGKAWSKWLTNRKIQSLQIALSGRLSGRYNQNSFLCDDCNWDYFIPKSKIMDPCWWGELTKRRLLSANYLGVNRLHLKHSYNKLWASRCRELDLVVLHTNSIPFEMEEAEQYSYNHLII